MGKGVPVTRQIRPRILFVGAFPPPGREIFGGAVTSCRVLLESSFPERADLILLDSTQISNPPPGFAVRLLLAARRFLTYLIQFERKRPDAVLLFTAAGASVVEKGAMAWYARFRGVPALISLRGGPVLDASNKSRFTRAWVRLALRGARTILCQGRAWQRFAVDVLGFQAEHAPIVPNWTATPALLAIGRSRRNATAERPVRCHDEPFADAANIPLYLLCEQLRGSIKVVLQGDGGDEIFAGYRRYNVLAHEWFWRTMSRAALGLSSMLPKGTEYYRKARFLSAIAESDPAMRMALLLTVETLRDAPTRILSLEYRQSAAKCDPFQRYRDLNRRFSSLDPVQKMLFTDISVLLPDTFLEKVDKSTMAHGIEVRVPFLDNDLATYAMSLPSELKVRRLQKKRILRRALRGIVPDWILDAPKMGFGVPYEYWLRGPLADYMKSVLLDPQTRASGLFDQREIGRAMTEHISGARNHGFLLWKALQLALWHRAYLDASEGGALA